MTLARPTYLVEILADPADDTGTVHTVKVMHGDQLRAELEAGRHMVQITEQPFALTSLWCWASMTRQHLTELDWPTWRTHVAVIAKPEDGDAQHNAVARLLNDRQEVDGLDPTQPGEPTPSPSP